MESPYLKWTEPSGGERTHEISGDDISIGRLSESTIAFNNPYVSRKHAVIERRDTDLFLKDLGSTHGTFVNGSRVTEHALRHGDRITLGRDQVRIEYFARQEKPSSVDRSPLDMEKSMAQLTSVIPIPTAESSEIEKISHLLDFQYEWEKSFSPEQTFEQILNSALELSGAERGFILLREENSKGEGGPSFKYVVGMNGQGELVSETEFQTSQSVVGKVVEEGKPVIMTENIDQDFAQQQSILAMDLRAVACLPLKWIGDDSQEQGGVRGILYLDSTKTMHALTGLDQKILNRLAVEAANVFEKLELIEAFRERKAVEKELALARETQTTLLPLQLPEVPHFQLAAFSKPTRHVGGDFYDFLPRESAELSGVLADVSGKGISAALLSSLVQGALQMECRSGVGLADSLKRINAYLCESSQTNRFVTLFLFSIAEDGSGEFISAGHNPSYLYRAREKKIDILSAGDMIVGAFPFADYTALPFKMETGDVLVLYSDGITEAMNPTDELFGEDRLQELIAANADRGCRELETSILDSIEQFTEGMPQTDDMTMVILQRV